MTYVCLWIPDWPTAGGPGPELEAALLTVVPRVVVEARGVVWADARGLDAPAVAEHLLECLEARGLGGVRAGVAAVPVAAFAAAHPLSREDEGGRVVVVEPGGERAFLSPLPVTVLEPGGRLAALLDGVGIRTCGPFAALEHSAVEVRFGAEGVRVWRLARADDPRRIFRPVPRERPHASLDFVDYVVTDPARLVFTANALLGTVCDALRSRGQHARRMRLTLELANGEHRRRLLRPARPTADRETWLRLVRGLLDRLELPDAVDGMRLEAEALEPAAVRQGDLFDPGFATASAVEAAVARLLEEQGEVVVTPEADAHPLAERRTRWRPLPPDAAASTDVPLSSSSPRREEERGGEAVPRLTLQLLPRPRPVRVQEDRGHRVPVRYHDGETWRVLVTAAGPDRISGGQWEDAPYAREYFRCVTDDGVLVWLFRDARDDAWYLHGWWD